MTIHATSSRHRAAAGTALALAALACFAALDTSTQAISALPVALVMWLRYASQAALVAGSCALRGDRLPWATRHPRLHGLRGGLLLATSVFTYLSLRVISVGEVTAIVMLTPVLLVVIGARAHGERLAPMRALLVAAAFAGALLVIKPGVSEATRAMLLPLAALACNVAFHLATSRLARTDAAATMQLRTGVTGTLLAAAALPWALRGLGSVPAATWGILALVCLLSTLGHGLLIAAYARAGLATLTPLLFAQIAFSTLLGALVFRRLPDGASLAGLGLIMSSGAACTALAARGRLAGSRAFPRERCRA